MSSFPEIIEKFQELFPPREGEELGSFPFECGDGWSDIIYNLCETICLKYNQSKRNLEWTKKAYEENKISFSKVLEVEKEVENERERLPFFHQIKEKWGHLTIYSSYEDDNIYNLVSFAEKMSRCTCETCGDKGRTWLCGWNRTLCLKHALEQYGEKQVVKQIQLSTVKHDAAKL